LEESITLCNGDNETLNAGNAGNTFNWSTGANTQIINVSTADTYIVTVSDANGCSFVDSTVVFLQNNIDVNLGNDTTICPTSSLILDAGNPGLSYLWSPDGQTTQTITVSGAGTYSVVAGDPSSSCFGTDEISVTVHDPPSLVSSMVACNDTNTFYTVTIEVTGGDADSYIMDGPGGSFNGNIYTSVPIPKDEAYTFFLSDGVSCIPVASGGIYDCDCTSDGGALENTPITICGDQVADVEVLVAATTDDNDIVRYALHESVPFDGNDIVYFATTPFFNFQFGMEYGQTYFITALSGNELTPGEVLLEDGCLGVSNSVPITFFQNPEVSIEFQGTLEVSCSDPSLILDGSSSFDPSGGTINYNWSAANSGNIVGATNTAMADINAAGTYYLSVSNSGGCTAIDSVEVVSNGDLPNINIETPLTVSCRDSIVILNASGSDSGPDYSITWGGDILSGETTLTPSVGSPGTYVLTILNNTNGCSATQPITVPGNFDTPVANVDPVFYMNCTTGMVAMEAFAFPPEPDYLLQWNTEDGEILSGENDWIVTAGSEGIYTIEITNALSGCSDTATTSIQPNLLRPTSSWLKWTFPICLGDDNGTMRVDSVQSGTAPFEYSFNGEPFTTDTFNYQLSAGENTIEIKDFFGCTWDTTVVFREGRELLVDLEEVFGPVELGDSIQLLALGSEDVDSVFWESPTLLSCYDCLDPWILPTDDSLRVGVQLYTPDGCTNRDSILIEVVKFRKVYIPNAFSPNGNRKNEFFSVFNSKEVRNINFLKVYNRWGGVVYEDRDLALNDKKNGWDGTHKNGRDALPGVYIFVVEIEFLDGLVQQYRGDFTLYK
ncbi:MAG: gliding motility-associated C-terminal domain-containing protein, partial [Saprospiraceae bacterium]